YGDHPGLPRALDAERVQRRWGFDMVDLDLRNLRRVRHEELHEGSVAQLAVRVVREPLVERAPDPLRDAALDLALNDQRIDQPTAVVDDHVLEDLEPERLWVDPHIRGMAARRPG